MIAQQWVDSGAPHAALEMCEYMRYFCASKERFAVDVVFPAHYTDNGVQ